MKHLTVIALALMLAIPAAAQSSQEHAGPGDHYWTLISVQLGNSLRAADEAVKTQALKNAVIFATLYRDKISITDHLRELSNIYEHSESYTNRNLALAAMQANGNGFAFDYLSRHVSPDETDQARLLVASVLNEYYQTRLALGTPFEIG